MIFRVPKTKKLEGVITSSGFGEPSIYHALVVIFLEFFAWGLLTSPMITVLNQTFPENTFLMNGLIVGIKGILSFLSAPLVGALSDIWGRKFFLLITVFFTCAPIPLMKINTWWYFAMISISGVFAVTFSVVFAYVADVTDESDRSAAYGLVSATFAASLVTSPALGAYLEMVRVNRIAFLNIYTLGSRYPYCTDKLCSLSEPRRGSQ
jgi:MFS family permease